MIRRRRKIRKMRGTRTVGGGSAKSRRGKGSHMGHHRTFSTNYMHVCKYEPERIKTKGFVGLHRKQKAINLRDIEKLSQENEVDVTNYGYEKVIGSGTISKPLVIKAKAFSAGAKTKIEQAGGKAENIGEAK